MKNPLTDAVGAYSVISAITGQRGGAGYEDEFRKLTAQIRDEAGKGRA